MDIPLVHIEQVAAWKRRIETDANTPSPAGVRATNITVVHAEPFRKGSRELDLIVVLTSYNTRLLLRHLLSEPEWADKIIAASYSSPDHTVTIRVPLEWLSIE